MDTIIPAYLPIPPWLTQERPHYFQFQFGSGSILTCLPSLLSLSDIFPSLALLIGLLARESPTRRAAYDPACEVRDQGLTNPCHIHGFGVNH